VNETSVFSEAEIRLWRIALICLPMGVGMAFAEINVSARAGFHENPWYLA
jgi:hypothetical protein